MSPSWTTILLHASNAPILPRESGRYSALTVNPSTHPSSPTSSPWFLTVTFASETASSSPVEAFFESKSLTGRVTLTLENDHHPSRRPEPKTVTLTEIPPSQATTLRQLTRPKFVGETNEKTRIRPRDAESRNKPDFRKNPTDATPRENHAITIFCIVAAVVAGIIFVLASIRRMFSGVKWSQKMFRMARTRRDGEGNGDGEQESGVENIEMDTQRRRFSESDVRSRSGERRGMSRGRDMDGEREEPLHVQHARSLSGLNRGVFTNGLIPEEDEEMDETRTLTGFRRSSSIEKHPADPLHPKKASLAQRLRNWTRRTKIGTPPSTNGTSALLPHSQENNHQAPFIAASAPSSSSPLSKKENQHPRKPSASMGKLKGCLKYAHRPPPRSSSSEAEGTYSENLVHRARGGSGGAGGSGNENGKDDGQRACSTGSIYTDARSTATGVVGPRAGRGASADLEGGGRRSVSWRLPG
ncbi:MAG: hypothetical protein M1817_006882 [Caeruleum heppii]|nr:MAG: hypothetical protein M1817_006882 [Caeruleum heppii]